MRGGLGVCRGLGLAFGCWRGGWGWGVVLMVGGWLCELGLGRWVGEGGYEVMMR